MQLIKKIKRWNNVLLILFAAASLSTFGKCSTVYSSFKTSETIICGPGSKTISFTNTSTGAEAGTATYDWYLNGVEFGTTSGFENVANSVISDIGTYAYMLIATDKSGCRDTAIVNVFIHPLPVANFTVTGNNCGGTTIIFKNISSGTGSFSTYTWDFGDGKKSVESNPSHTYTAVNAYVVSLTVHNGGVCSNTYKDTIKMIQGPVAVIEGKDNDGDTKYCLAPSDSTTLDTVKFYNTSSNAQSFRWDFGDGSPLLTTSSKDVLTHVYKNYGTFKITMIATSANGCEKTVNLTVVFNRSVKTAFTLQASELSGCASHAVMPVNTSLNADMFLWNFGDGTPVVTTTNMAPFLHIYRNAGVYTISLKASNSCNSESFLSDSIRVGSQPVSKFELTPSTGCAPQSVAFTNKTQAFASNTYHWNFGDGSVWDDPASPQPKIYNEGKWKIVLVATNTCGSDSSFQILTINPSPAPPLVSSETICSGNSTKLVVKETLGTYEWFDEAVNGNLLASGTQFTSPPLTANTTFYVQCKSGHCVSKRTAVTVSVLPLPNPPTTSGVTICKGTKAIINLGTLGKYEWYDAATGGNLLDSTPSFTTPPLFASTNYFVLAVSGKCKSKRSPVSVTVNDPPKANYETNTVCLGEATVFKDISTGNPNSWLWDFGDGTTDHTGPRTKHTYLTAGSFITKLITANGIGCMDSLFQITVVHDLIKVAITAKDSACPFELLSFQDNSGQGTDSIVNSNWYFGDNTPVANTLQATHAYSQPGTYTIKHEITSDKGCRSSATVPLYIEAFPVADFSFVNTCQIQKSIFNDHSEGNVVKWDWDFGDQEKSTLQHPLHTFTTSGYYNVSLAVQTSIGCADTLVHQVFVYPQPIASFTSDIVCWGEKTTFSNTSQAVDGNIDQVFWNFDDGTSSNEFNPKHTLLTHKDSFNVILSIVTSHGCTDTITQAVKTNPLPLFNFFATEKVGCEAFTTAFYDSSTVSGGKITSWLWDFGDGNFTHRRYPIHTFANAGSYYVTLKVTSSYGCQSSKTLSYPIVVHPQPKAAFTATPDEVGIEQPTIQFIDASEDGELWDWDFGDYKTSVNRNPFHTYSSTGTFTVTQIVINKYGCNDTAYQTVRVNPEPTIYIPNAFSPGSNGLNDVFLPVGNGINIFHMQIFDRFGKEIFETSELSNGWNGKINGQDEIVPEGIYVYKIYIEDALHIPHEYMGSVFVARQ
jgi:gliding motility-associated-like protein